MELITPQTNVNGIYVGKPDSLWWPYYDRSIRYIKCDLERAKRLSALYIKYGKIFNKRADIAFAQMTHETGWLMFTGDVKPEQNNFVGIGATGGVPGNSFETEELGIIAHYAHLCWYLDKDKVNDYCTTQYDPRHFGLNGGHPHYKFNGDSSLGRLTGSWAVPGKYTQPNGTIITYSGQIANIANGINKHDVSEYFDIIIQMGHVGRTSGSTGTYREQEFNKDLGYAINHILKDNKKLKYRLMGADDWLSSQPNKCTVFFSIHGDGSTNKQAAGFSCGFKIDTNQDFKEKLAVSYGNLCKFTRRKDNYTSGLRLYYSWTPTTTRPARVSAMYTCLLEHGFLTNDIEREWLFENINKIARHHADFILNFFNL